MLLELLKPIALLLAYAHYKRDRLRLENLMKSGLKIGRNVYIGSDVFFDSVYPYLIEIGDNCRISYAVHIIAHDATAFRDLGINRIAPVKILQGTFIGLGAIILPGVTIGPNAVIAAGSVVNRDIGEGKIAAGNPARPYGDYADLLNNYHNNVKRTNVFNKEDIEAGIVSPEQILAELKESPVAFTRGVPKKDPFYVNTRYEEMRDNARKVFQKYIVNGVSKNQSDKSQQSDK